jgi:hypothetical protein
MHRCIPEIRGLSNAKDEGQNLSLVLEDLELQKKSIHRGGFFVLRISALKR